MSKNIKNITKISMIAGIYAAITFATFFISFGAVQYRVSESLTVLPLFSALAIPGLTLGCVVANLIGVFMGVNPVGFIDAIFGSVATLIAGILTYQVGKSSNKFVRYLLAPLPPVMINALVIGFEISYFFVGSISLEIFLFNTISVFIGQAVICYGIGIPLMIALEKNDIYKKIL